ncbi:GtrA family protein [Streptomyces sp. NPDC002490]|uniref:GtrA family protein n=1 Tax=Streptomyces sp. NPDC002490 TaxID=3154416 RepID=UPI003332403A
MGAFGWIVDVAVFNFCIGVLDLQPVRSGVMASAVAMCVNYLGNRYWTYGDRAAGKHGREMSLFLVYSLVGTGIQNGVLAISHYGLDFTSALADNLAKNVVGLALGSLFRFWAYRTRVFRPAGGTVREEPVRDAEPPAVPRSEEQFPGPLNERAGRR